MKKHISKVCQATFFELKRISSIRRYLTDEATRTLVTSCVLSRLDYCNSLLMGCPLSVLQPLQKVQNSAARLIFKTPHNHPCTPLFKDLHWLPISERINYKVASMCYNSLTGSAPTYLTDLLHIYTPSRSLRSASDTRKLKLQLYKRKSHGYRSFSCFGPQLWNSLPYHVRHSPSADTFKRNLKTHLFNCYYNS